MRIMSDKVLINIINKDYPEIIAKIIGESNKNIPDNILEDFSKIPLIIESFRVDRGLSRICFLNESGKRNVTEDRELLIALILLFYNPKRLFSLITRERKILDEISSLTGATKLVLSRTVRSSIFKIKAYRPFKEEVYRIYDLINSEHKFFNN